jgi:hypothetical protein
VQLINGSDVTFTWGAAPAGTVTKYVVSSNPAAAQGNVTATSATFTGLQCGPVYTFTVIAVGPTGLQSTPNSTTSKACQAPAGPLNLRDLGYYNNPYGIQPKWDPPTNAAVTGPITYTMTVNPPMMIPIPLPDPYRMTGFKPGQQITVTVTAGSGAGAGTSETVVMIAGSKWTAPETIDMTPVAKKYGCSPCSAPAQISATSWNDATNSGTKVADFSQGQTVTAYCEVAGGSKVTTGPPAGRTSTTWSYAIGNGGVGGYISNIWYGLGITTLPPC